jgi:hypothetical protein
VKETRPMADHALLLIHDAASPAADAAVTACAAAGITVRPHAIPAAVTELAMAVLGEVNTAALVAVAGDSPACAVARAVATARGTLVAGAGIEGWGDALLTSIAAHLDRPALAAWVTARQTGPAALVQWAQAHPDDPLAPAAALGVDATGYASLVAAATAARSGGTSVPVAAPFPPGGGAAVQIMHIRAAFAVVLALLASVLWLVPVADDWHGVEFAIIVAHGFGSFPLAALLGTRAVYRRCPMPQGVLRGLLAALLAYLAITLLSLLLIPASAIVMFGHSLSVEGVIWVWSQLGATIYTGNLPAVGAFAAAFLLLQSLPPARLVRLGALLGGARLRTRCLLIGTMTAAVLTIGATVMVNAQAQLGIDTVAAMERAGLFDPDARQAKRGWLFPDAVPTLKLPAFAQALARFQASVGLEATGQPDRPTLAALKALPEKRDWVVDPGGKGDFTDIGAAVARARDGHRVLIRPGTFRANLFIGNAVSLVGEGPSEAIRLEAADPAEPVVTLSCAQCLLAGITLDARGRADAVLVSMAHGAPTVRGNRLVGGSSALTVSAADPKEPTTGLVADNDFVAGAGLWFRDGAGTRLIGNRIVSAQPDSVIVLEKGSNIDLIDNRITGAGDKVLVFAASGSRAGFSRNRFSAPATNCLYIANGADVEIRDNQFDRCGTRGGYDSIYIKRGGKARLANNSFIAGSLPTQFEGKD